MQLLVMIVLSLMMMLAATGRSTQQAIDAPKAVATARAQLDQYQLFMYVATRYMQGYAGGAATIKWPTLKTASGVPSGALNAGMPASWKVVAAADNSWVACTVLDESTVAGVQALAASGGQSLIPATVSSTNYIVVGSAADSGKASLCN